MKLLHVGCATAIILAASSVAWSKGVLAATIYTVEIVGGGVAGDVQIIDSANPFPGSDTWSAVQPRAFGVSGGNLGSWSTNDAELHGVGAVPILTLSGFTKATKEGQTGTGRKHNADGSMPAGPTTWRCKSKN